MVDTVHGVKAAEDESDSIALTANAIFSNSHNEFSLDDGTVVRVTPAKMGSLGGIMKFFEALINKIPPSELAGIVRFVAERQKAAIARGEDPMSINLQSEIAQIVMAGTGKESDPEAVAKGALSKAGMLMSLLSATMDELPKVVPAFTNLSKEKFEDLEIDEAMVVVGTIFMVNYSFFTQKLRPVLMAFLAGVVSKRIAGAAIEESPARS